MYTTRHYAHALFDLAAASELVAVVVRDLEAVQATLGTSAKVKALLADTSRLVAERQQLLRDWCGKDIQPLVVNTLLVMIDSGDLDQLPALIMALKKLAEQAGATTEAVVTSAQPLHANEQKQLETTLRAQYGKTLTVQYAVDSALIGGVRINIGSTVIDDSIADRLRQLRLQLVS